MGLGALLLALALGAITGEVRGVDRETQPIRFRIAMVLLAFIALACAYRVIVG